LKYYEVDQTRKMRLLRHSTNGGNEKCVKNFRKSKGKRPLGRYGHEWEDNIKLGLKNSM
jgi:hypothetical protein